MEEFLTVKEATQLVGKSHTTIYRLCQKYSDTPYVKKEDNLFLVSREFLLAKYPDGSDTTEDETNSDFSSDEVFELIDHDIDQAVAETQQRAVTSSVEFSLEESIEKAPVQEDNTLVETLIGVGTGAILIAGFIYYLFVKWHEIYPQ